MIVAQTNGINCITCLKKNLTMIFTSKFILKKDSINLYIKFISHYDLIT